MEKFIPTEVIKHFENSQSALAEAVGVSRQAVHQWFKQNEIPLLRIYQIKEILDNRDANEG